MLYVAVPTNAQNVENKLSPVAGKPVLLAKQSNCMQQLILRKRM